MGAIAVVLDHTTATALYDPKDPYNKAVAAFYVQASSGLGTLYAPWLSLTVVATERPGLLAYINELRFIQIEPLATEAALTATELLHVSYFWVAAHAIHAARPCAGGYDEIAALIAPSWRGWLSAWPSGALRQLVRIDGRGLGPWPVRQRPQQARSPRVCRRPFLLGHQCLAQVCPCGRAQRRPAVVDAGCGRDARTAAV